MCVSQGDAEGRMGAWAVASLTGMLHQGCCLSPGMGHPACFGAVGEGVGKARGGSGAGHTHWDMAWPWGALVVSGKSQSAI